MSVFIHPAALCESPSIGDGTRVWAFAHVLPEAVIGEDCNICDGVFVENDVRVGNRVTVKSGVQLWDGITLEDDVFVGPNATFTNDLYPRSRVRLDGYLRTVVERGASIGANATILPGLTIGAGAMVGAGSVVTRDVPGGIRSYQNGERRRGSFATSTEPSRRPSRFARRWRDQRPNSL
jgi:UDP-2-acetamido-3-amino-2,3-dideoxy-glucuronate N-acetyltransferase